MTMPCDIKYKIHYALQQKKPQLGNTTELSNYKVQNKDVASYSVAGKRFHIKVPQ